MLSCPSIFVLVLCCVLGVNTSAQDSDPTCPSPVPPPTIAANPLLVAHTNFFCPVKVYNLKNDSSSGGSVPSGLNYNVYTAVGYDLANSMMLVGPSGVIIIDTLGEDGSAATAIQEFKTALNQSPAEHLPVKAVIYTHNHIDHIGGVQQFLNESGLNPCPPQKPIRRSGWYLHGPTRLCRSTGTSQHHRWSHPDRDHLRRGDQSALRVYVRFVARREPKRRGAAIDLRANAGIDAVRAVLRADILFNQQMEFIVAGVTLQARLCSQ